MEDGGDFVLDGGGGDAFETHLGDEVAEGLPKAFRFCFGHGRRSTGSADNGALSLREFEEAFFGELAVGFGDGVEVDAQLRSEAADGGQGIAGREGSLIEVQTDLPDDLAADRRGGVGGEGDACFWHGFTVHGLCTVRNSILYKEGGGTRSAVDCDDGGNDGKAAWVSVWGGAAEGLFAGGSGAVEWKGAQGGRAGDAEAGDAGEGGGAAAAEGRADAGVGVWVLSRGGAGDGVGSGAGEEYGRGGAAVWGRACAKPGGVCGCGWAAGV